MNRLRRVLSWQVTAPVVAYLLAALLTISVIQAFVVAHDAIDARNRTAAAASRRIDLLNAQITQLQNRLAGAAKERGRLEEAITILARQVRAMGGQPAVTQATVAGFGTPPRPSPSPSPRPQRSPSPKPSHSPSPSPSSTGFCVRALGHQACIHGL